VDKLVIRESSLPSKRDANKTLLNLMYKWFVPHADSIIVQSLPMLEDVTKICNIKKEKITVIPNPYTLHSSPSKETKKSRYFVIVGRLEPVKGILPFIDALSVKKLGEYEIKIIGIGSQEEKIRQKLVKFNGKVELIGDIDDVSYIIANSDGLISPSVYEGLPNVVIEALWNGIAVAGLRNAGGIIDLVDHGFNGLLVADYTELSNVLKHLSDLTHLQGNSIAHDARSRFSKEVIFAKYLDTVVNA
jgi:GalNAc-alpha-(1->4)-GalNAc-alpha-(1->3)-diNAcBac-PP-undecaprenol alpha-1,4-N-acetyl-D-galactosaminyltransferase